ncbi:MAG: hypothetical protein ACRBCS_03030 [Cellvibrionaceae bacterium]
MHYQFVFKEAMRWALIKAIGYVRNGRDIEEIAERANNFLHREGYIPPHVSISTTAFSARIRDTIKGEYIMDNKGTAYRYWIGDEPFWYGRLAA